MASFAQSLRTFRGGNISYDDLLGEVDRILADGRTDATWLLATLREEEAKSPLPADLCSALRDKLEPLAQKEVEFVNFNKQKSKLASKDLEGTRLATAFHRNSNKIPDNDESNTDLITLHNGIDPIKGMGDVLNNRFELQECVGSGGMSSVYKAIDRRKVEANDRHPHVAVKVLNLEFRAHPDSLIALQREAKKCQSLAHPNIVRVYDFDRDGSTVYMTMEYLSGMSLGRKMREPDFTGMPRDEALRIINDAGQALRFAHDSGIVHADFKPANVFITDVGRIKVIDFGIARAFQRDDAVEIEATRFDVGSLQALTPNYASPQMLEHQKPNPRDDIYALACTAYEMLTGRHPFGRVPANVAHETGLKLQRHMALTRSQFYALKRALEFDRDKRTATVNQFLKEINKKSDVIEKIAIVSGFIVLIVAVSMSYYFFYRSKEEVFNTANRVGQSQDKAKATSGSPQLNASTADNIKLKSSEQSLQDEPTTKIIKSDGQALAPQQSVGKTITIADVTQQITNMTCSALKATIRDDTIYMKGFALKQDKQILGNKFSMLAGTGQVDLSGIDTVNKQQCAVLDILSGYWRINQSMKHRLSVVSNKAGNLYMEGDNLVLKITTPDYDSFIYVDYYSVDGGVAHMVPSTRFRANEAPALYNATIGDLGEWTIARPFGTELITVMTTSEPLFIIRREEYEPRKNYLSDLEKRLTKLESKGNTRINADFILIRTKARQQKQGISKN